MKEQGAKQPIEEKLDIYLIGMNEVGKTSFISQFIGGKLPEQYQHTESLNSKGKEETIKEKKYMIYLHEFPTNFDNNVIRVLKCEGIIFMFDITNKDSFDYISQWIDWFQLGDIEDASLILLGNKKDIENKEKINKYDIEKLTEKIKIPFSEISCNKEKDVKNALHMLIEKIEEDRKAPTFLRKKEKGDKSQITNRRCFC